MGDDFPHPTYTLKGTDMDRSPLDPTTEPNRYRTIWNTHIINPPDTTHFKHRLPIDDYLNSRIPPPETNRLN